MLLPAFRWQTRSEVLREVLGLSAKHGRLLDRLEHLSYLVLHQACQSLSGTLSQAGEALLETHRQQAVDIALALGVEAVPHVDPRAGYGIAEGA